MTKVATKVGERWPAGRARVRVRGLAASMVASTRIEGHGGGTGSEHGDDDPEKLMDCGKAGGGEHGSAEREGESEDRMLPLDHLESDAEIVEDGHRKIVRQLSVLGPQNAEWKDDWASEDALPYGSARASLCEKLASIPKVRS